MKIALINQTATYFDSNGNVHLNNQLTDVQVESIKELIFESQSPRLTPERQTAIEAELLSIISPKVAEKKEVLKEVEKKIETVKKTATSIALGEESGKYFALNENSDVYYKGFKEAENVTLPSELIKHILEIEKKGESILPYVHFWELALANPDKNSRSGLFKFVQKQRLIITEKGYIVCYRRALVTDGTIDPNLEFQMSEITRLRKQKGNLNKYSFANIEGVNTTLDHRTKKYTDYKGESKTYAEVAKDIESGKSSSVTLTDNHTKKMRFGIGSVVSIDRSKCDSNPKNECSYGLHIGSRHYVGTNSWAGNLALLCLVNPSKVVSVPYADAHKMRVCEYKIISAHEKFEDLEKFEDSDIRVMEHEYTCQQVEEIKELLENKKFDKENYSANAELFLQYAEIVKDLEVAKSGLNVTDTELEELREKIKKS